ncbi:MAG: AbrB family transcriptional regulator [Nitrosopumilus sp. B06]|nr:MAG: AbrB family transcriptional regulator [Nitrosopumilus sp. B06]
MMETTKLTPANISKSLRTTIPIQIIRQMKLETGDRIEWDLDKVGNMWIATIRKMV